MKVCVAQTKPVKASIPANLQQQLKLIDAAIANDADVILFPELSLTAYEPQLARTLALHADDAMFKILQQISDAHDIIIGTSAPLIFENDVSIALVFFHPNEDRQVYHKQYLHEDEKPFFVGCNNNDVLIRNTKIAMAICYELSAPAHIEKACENGANIYVASVAKTASGVENAYLTLSAIAAKYSMPVLMSNSVGFCDNFYSAGRSAVWNEQGSLLASLEEEEGLIVFDDDSGEVVVKPF